MVTKNSPGALRTVNIQATKRGSAQPPNINPKKPASTEETASTEPAESFQRSRSTESGSSEWKHALAVVGRSVSEGILQGAGTAFIREIAFAAGGPVAGGVATVALMAAGGYEGVQRYSSRAEALTGSKALGKLVGATMGAGKVGLYASGTPGDYTGSILTGMSQGAVFGLIEAPGKI